MAGKITKKFRLHNAKQFYEQFTESDPSNIYYFIGRVEQWPDDLNPPLPLDTVEMTDYEIWHSMIAMKRISPSDVSFAVRRIDWENGEVYDSYRFDQELSTKRFFVLNNIFNVYMCISNANGAPSTIQPTSVSTSPFTTADGYVWKFLFTINAADALRFLTTLFTPVKTLLVDDGSSQWGVQEAVANGSIGHISVESGGVGYRHTSGTLINANTSAATLAVTANTTNDIYRDSTIYIVSGPGAGQLRDIVQYDGGVDRIAYVNPVFDVEPTSSSTYIVSPKVTVTGDGEDALAYSRATDGIVTSIINLDNGANYSFAEAIITANGGSGAVVLPHISPFGGIGADPVTDLAAHNIVMNVRLTGDEGNTFTTENDYRILGMMVDPLLLVDDSVANSSVYDLTTKLEFGSPSSEFTKDEQIIGDTSGATATVVELQQVDLLSVHGNRISFANGEIITGQTSGAAGVITGITEPEIKKFSGEVLYYEFRPPIQRDLTQQEDTKIILRF